ncbi:pyridoxamine 5'-phosphate oxidase family protein [Plantactinospora endophytica]|uniref:Pyridoxamine 5'-phosphate oxidase N-terminal domain-containing protein n=1 Tax=Plantactinospora endophytica TaxID=673535 RepID=A0ABQ4DU53_9ACTN|nr:pyridoxamine 5'-phosphate oxidase family protein [Plantactinospora endophytica]GIG85986.1 hypothetical protein Pen02_09220 [Plantactinospora endophytica]
MLPNLSGAAADRAEQRLRDQTVLWLTTVSPSGQPQTSPVGYAWNGQTFLILSKPGIAKVRNLRRNPRVAMHLDLDTEAEEYTVLTIEGIAELDAAPPGVPAPLTRDEVTGYLDKHLESMRWAQVTPEQTFADYSTVIRVTPTRARCY